MANCILGEKRSVMFTGGWQSLARIKWEHDIAHTEILLSSVALSWIVNMWCEGIQNPTKAGRESVDTDQNGMSVRSP